jgi:outer membrane immunogenic protein
MKYKGFLLATAGSVATMSGAQAADLPVKAPMVIPPPVSSWQGFYLGLNAGVVSQTAKADPGYGTYSSGTNGGYGFIGGGQIGYNWQIAPTWVLGLEGDISGLTGKAIAGASSVGKGNQFEGQISWLSTFRGRAGWLMNPSTMLYATGGLAVGGVKNSFNFNGLGFPLTTKSVSKTKTGWTVGGGIESMFDRHWTAGLEVLYVDLGTSSATINTSSGSESSSGSKTTTFRNQAVIGRAKLNYKF